MLPQLSDLTATARVITLPLTTRFRGITQREALVFEGPEGWSEFSPFLEYDDDESCAWLAAAIDFAWQQTPPLVRERVPVNATMPAVAAADVESVLARFGAARTVKIKVAEPSQTLVDDTARVARVRELLGPAGRIRVDANGGWNVDEAEHAIHALAPYDLEYIEQPCATVEELAEIRTRVKYMGLPIAADESVRKADDPVAVARAGAADILVLKAQPLGGIGAALAIVREAGLPAVVSSALDTSIGISMGLHLAGALPELDYDCGLGTAALLDADIVERPLVPVDGYLEVARVTPSATLLELHAASTQRTEWWMQRLERTYRVLTSR